MPDTKTPETLPERLVVDALNVGTPYNLDTPEGDSVAMVAQVVGDTSKGDARRARAHEIARRYNLHKRLVEALDDLASGKLTPEQSLALARAASKLAESRED